MEEINLMPEVNNLLNIFSGVTDKTKNELIMYYEGQNFSNFKKDLSDALIEKITPIGNEIKKLIKHRDNLNQKLYLTTSRLLKSEIVLNESI